MSGLFINGGMCGYSFVAASFSSTITPTFAFSFFVGWLSDSDELLTSSACAVSGVGFLVGALPPTLVFEALVETGNTERRPRFTLPVAGGDILVCATSSRGRLPLLFPADGVLEGAFTEAFFVACLPFFVALAFSGGCSYSLDQVVRPSLDELELELDGVAAFRFAGCFFSSVFALLVSSLFSCASDFFNALMSFPLEIAGEGAVDILETLPCPVLIFTTSGVGVPHTRASHTTFWFNSNIPNGSIVSSGVA